MLTYLTIKGLVALIGFVVKIHETQSQGSELLDLMKNDFVQIIMSDFRMI